jgi:hypothetical protein
MLVVYLSSGVSAGIARLGDESESIVRLLACPTRAISKRLGDSRPSGRPVSTRLVRNAWWGGRIGGRQHRPAGRARM